MARRFDNSSDYLGRTANLPTNTNFTAMGWAQLTSDLNDYQTLFSLQQGTSNQYLLLTTNSNGTDLAIWGQAFGAGTSIADLTLNSWFFWFFECAGAGANQMRGGISYLADSGFTTAQDASGSTSAPNNMRLGNDTFDERWAGDIGPVYIYDAVLSDDEKLAQKYRYLPVRTANLNIYSPFTDSASATFVDYSGNGRNWTQGGTVDNAAPPPISWGAPRRRIITAAAEVDDWLPQIINF